MNNNIEIVNNIYEAFSQGDVSTIMNYLSDNVEWEPWFENYAQIAGAPWLKAQKGKDGVLELFMVVGELIFKDFRVLSVTGHENHVAADIILKAEIPATGGRLKEEAIHLWTFNNQGKVIRFQHYAGTASHREVAKASNQLRN